MIAIETKSLRSRNGKLLSPAAEAERSIIKKFRKTIWNPFVGGIKDYHLIQEGDAIAVCISGGKDSMLLAKCMQHLQKYSEIPFSVQYLVMDPGYTPQNRQKIVDNAARLEIPIRIFDSPIFRVVEQAGGSPCYLCARMRRGYLYKQAQALGCNKIALGHHFDDAVETILMSLLYGAEFKTMMPKLHSTNFAGMELIRPLYLVKEEHIIAWRNYHRLEFLQCACRFTEQCAAAPEQGVSKRQETKALIRRLRQDSPNIDKNIFRSIHNINLQTVIGYRFHDDGPVRTFLDEYERGS